MRYNTLSLGVLGSSRSPSSQAAMWSPGRTSILCSLSVQCSVSYPSSSTPYCKVGLALDGFAQQQAEVGVLDALNVGPAKLLRSVGEVY